MSVHVDGRSGVGMTNGRRGREQTGQGDGAIQQSIAEIVRLQQRDRLAMSFSDHIADGITGFSGSMLYAWLHVVWFAAWIVINVGWTPIKPFDPFPFGLLTMVVSLEAIFLSTFVLISQNRQALQADRRAKIDLQVDVIAEQEVTKILQLLEKITNHLGIAATDAEVREMRRATDIARPMDEIDEAERRLDPEGAKGPDSAVDTEA